MSATLSYRVPLPAALVATSPWARWGRYRRHTRLECPWACLGPWGMQGRRHILARVRPAGQPGVSSPSQGIASGGLPRRILSLVRPCGRLQGASSPTRGSPPAASLGASCPWSGPAGGSKVLLLPLPRLPPQGAAVPSRHVRDPRCS